MANDNEQIDGIYLTALEAARMLRLSREDFYKKLREGQVPGAVKVFGKTWRIERIPFIEGIRAMSGKEEENGQ